MSGLNKAFFLDRDGVLNTMVFRLGKLRAPYTLEEFSLFPQVPEALAALKGAGYKLIVVTNQPDVARGWVSRDAVDLVNGKIRDLLPVDDIEVCFHTEKDACECRKPKPGMLLRAARNWDIDLSRSFMVGDRYSDVEAGVSAGCRSVLIGAGEAREKVVEPYLRSSSLWAAVQVILKLPG